MIFKKKAGKKTTLSEIRAGEAHKKEVSPEYFHTYMSRRELFEQGFTGVTATLMAPSLLSLLLRSQEAQAAIYADRPAFIFTMQGGASFGPEVVLSDINGELTLTPAAHRELSGGLQLSLTDPNVATPISRKYGAGLWTEGLLFRALEGQQLPAQGAPGVAVQITGLDPAIRNNLKIVVFQHARTDDDTNTNPNVPSHLMAASAMLGTSTLPLVRAIQNGSNSEAGGNGRPTLPLPGFKPGSGNSIQDLASLTSLKQGALQTYSPDQLKALSRAIASFGEKQMQAPGVAAGSGRQQFVTTAKEAADNMYKLVDRPPDTNVFADPIMQRPDTFNVPALSPASPTEDQVIAANVKMVLDGVAPLAVFNMRGDRRGNVFDYHTTNGTASAPLVNVRGTGGPGDTVGLTIGLGWRETLHPLLIDRTIRTLNAMYRKGKSGTISWVTDGSVRFSSGPANAPFDLAAATGEGGQTGHTAVMFILNLDPDAPPVQKFYLGGFDRNLGGAITDTNLNILARGPEYEGLAIYATYLGSRGAITYDQINELLPKGMQGDRALIDSLLKMNMFVR